MLVLDILVASPIIVAIWKNIMDLEACGDINEGVDDNLALKTSVEFTLVVSHVEVVNNGVCDINTVALIDYASSLVIASHDSLLADFKVALSPNKEVSNINVPLVDAPISLISDWLKESFSSPCRGVKEDLDDPTD
ncbi:hypothetical protein MA16_Dca023342 [Dendrobium catenatum]|uniref:Uncharacterized protein n=1 Tax=Dendrobium catenatum TaxID=906689 RepID=A0A2I0WP26_9ASPA|nr:hypothetical protein MA16_Dca023342 [Dendrobium catenatum]